MIWLKKYVGHGRTGILIIHSWGQEELTWLNHQSINRFSIFETKAVIFTMFKNWKHNMTKHVGSSHSATSNGNSCHDSGWCQNLTSFLQQWNIDCHKIRESRASVAFLSRLPFFQDSNGKRKRWPFFHHSNPIHHYNSEICHQETGLPW